MFLLYNRVIISTPLFKYVWSLKQRADPLTWNIHQGKEILKEVDSWRIFWRGQLCSEVYKSECLVCCLLQELPNVCILGVVFRQILTFIEDSFQLIEYSKPIEYWLRGPAHEQSKESSTNIEICQIQHLMYKYIIFL